MQVNKTALFSLNKPKL